MGGNTPGKTLERTAARLNPSFFMDTDLPFGSSNRTLGAGRDKHLIHIGFFMANNSVGCTSCPVEQSHVEAAIDCARGLDCRAVRVRRSQMDKRPSHITPLDDQAVTENLFINLPKVQLGFDGPSLTERFLNDSGTLIAADAGHALLVMARVAPAALGSRLALILNTYHLAFLPNNPGSFYGENVGDPP
jgi:hypothetical protein